MVACLPACMQHYLLKAICVFIYHLSCFSDLLYQCVSVGLSSLASLTSVRQIVGGQIPVKRLVLTNHIDHR